MTLTTLLREFERCIPKIPIARPLFQMPNLCSQIIIFGLFDQWGRRLECWPWSASCPKYYVLYTTAGIARCSQLSSSCQVRQHGLPFPASIMVKITPSGPLSIYSLAGVTYSDPIGPSFAEYSNVPSNTFDLASSSWHMPEIESGTQSTFCMPCRQVATKDVA
jgi:hypothetical protein